MNAITGTPEEILAKVQAIVEQQVPGVVCGFKTTKLKSDAARSANAAFYTTHNGPYGS